MYILYLDESGVPNPHFSQTSHYVLLGMAVHVDTWFQLSGRVRALKEKYSRDGKDFELHGAWLLRSYREQSLIPGFEDLDALTRYEAVQAWRERRKAEWPTLGRERQREKKDFKRTEPYLHLTRIDRDRLYREALRIVGESSRGITLFGEAIDKRALPTSIDPVEEAFSRVVERFESFLNAEGLWGILVVDHDPQQADRFASLLQSFQRADSRRGGVDRIIEAPFFLESQSNEGVQVADLCAYALRRYIENGEEEPFADIYPRFCRMDSALQGVRHLTAEGCSCRICMDRLSQKPPWMSFAGSIDTGDPNSIQTVDEVAYGRDRP